MKRRTNPEKPSSNSSHGEDLARLVREELARTVPDAIRRIAVERTEIFSGPIPAPSACRDYEQVLPGFTDRALRLAENAQAADAEARSRADRFELAWRICSLVAALLLAGGVILAGTILLLRDKNLAGFGILLTGLSTIITALLTRPRDRRK